MPFNVILANQFLRILPGYPKHPKNPHLKKSFWTEALPGYGSNQNDHLHDQVREYDTLKDFPNCPLVRNII